MRPWAHSRRASGGGLLGGRSVYTHRGSFCLQPPPSPLCPDFAPCAAAPGPLGSGLPPTLTALPQLTLGGPVISLPLGACPLALFLNSLDLWRKLCSTFHCGAHSPSSQAAFPLCSPLQGVAAGGAGAPGSARPVLGEAWGVCSGAHPLSRRARGPQGPSATWVATAILTALPSDCASCKNRVGALVSPPCAPTGWK